MTIPPFTKAGCFANGGNGGNGNTQNSNGNNGVSKTPTGYGGSGGKVFVKGGVGYNNANQISRCLCGNGSNGVYLTKKVTKMY